jgi:hypothetical protein
VPSDTRHSRARPADFRKWRGELDHFQRRLRTELAEPIPARLRTVDALRKLLGQETTQAIVFSTNPRLLAGIGEIVSTLDDVINTDIGAIVSILPGELAPYWGEERDAKFLLRTGHSRDA